MVLSINFRINVEFFDRMFVLFIDVLFNCFNKLKKEIATPPTQWCTQDLAKREAQPGAWGLRPQPPTHFCGFHIKTLILAHLFIEKRHAVSAVTIDNAKIFS